MKKAISGFTIVELLIVVVVIAVLAAISAVAYTGIQSRANDASVKAGVKQFETAFRLWAQDHPSPIIGGYGSTIAVTNGMCSDVNAGGWVATGVYVCTIGDALVSTSTLPSGFFRTLPQNTYYNTATTDGRFAIMFYKCSSFADRYALYWTLQNPSAEEGANLETIRSTCGQNVMVRDNWGMRAAKIIQL